jgi:hypothetical protein
MYRFNLLVILYSHRYMNINPRKSRWNLNYCSASKSCINKIILNAQGPTITPTMLKSAYQGVRVEKNTLIKVIDHHNSSAKRLSESQFLMPKTAINEKTIALLKNIYFHNGIIEATISGQPQMNAGEGARGFVGIAFRVSKDTSKMELFYIRPTNGRANDQVRKPFSLRQT